MNQPFKLGRVLLLVCAMFLLVMAGWAGLLRMGWQLPPIQPLLASFHGPLMVSGFLGTVIGLERAVGLGLKWTYAGPVLTGAGALLLVAGISEIAGAVLINLGSVVLVAVFAYIVKHQPHLHAYTMAGAAVAWLGGNLLWLFGQPIAVVAVWWAGFLILTIAGERLELARLIAVTARARGLFVAAAAVYVAGMVVVVADYTLGWRITGAGMLALAAWLLSNDIARRTVRQEGLTRFIAVCLLSGYVWLGISGGLALAYGFLYGGVYDAVLHAIFLGFVFTMIFGHAPVIFPAVLGVPIPYRSAFYIHLGLLHFSLAIRVGAGLMEYQPLRLWGAMLNGIALLAFVANTALAARAGIAEAKKNPRRPGPRL